MFSLSKFAAIAAWGAMLVSGGPALALTDEEAARIVELAGLNSASLERLKAEFPQFAKPKRAGRSKVAGNARESLAATPAGASRPEEPKNISPCPGWTVMVRQSWADIGILECPVPVSKAAGASLSFTNDFQNVNQLWATQGMVALRYSNLREFYPGQNVTFQQAFGVYAQVNRKYNSNRRFAAGNTDYFSGGVAGEVGFAQANGDIHLFRLSGGGVTDNIRGVTTGGLTFDYIPAMFSLGLWDVRYLFGGALSYQIDPVIKVQYDRTTDAGDLLLFSGGKEALRVGPEITVLMKPLPFSKNDFIDRIGLNLTYHPSYEAYSRRGLHWFSGALTYRLDEKGHIGLALIYEKGSDQNTGEAIDYVKVSLSGKL